MKDVGAWLVPEDEDAVDRAAGEVFDGAWQCSNTGPLGLHPVHLHRSLDSVSAIVPALPATTAPRFMHRAEPARATTDHALAPDPAFEPVAYSLAGTGGNAAAGPRDGRRRPGTAVSWKLLLSLGIRWS